MPEDYYNKRFDRLETLLDERTKDIPEFLVLARAHNMDISDLKADIRANKAEVSALKLTCSTQIAKCPRPELDQFKRWIWGIVASIMILMFGVFYRGFK